MLEGMKRKREPKQNSGTSSLWSERMSAKDDRVVPRWVGSLEVLMSGAEPVLH